MASIKASRYGLTQIKQAIAKQGWKMSDDNWLVEASKVLEPQKYWHEDGPYAYGCSRQTWERFLQGRPIRDRSFKAFCQVLEDISKVSLAIFFHVIDTTISICN